MSESATKSELGQVLAAIQSMQSDIQAIDKKLGIYIVRTEEQFNTVNEKLKAVNEKLDELAKRQNATDGRLWAFLVAMFFTVVGLLAKVTIFDWV